MIGSVVWIWTVQVGSIPIMAPLVGVSPLHGMLGLNPSSNMLIRQFGSKVSPKWDIRQILNFIVLYLTFVPLEYLT